MSQVLTVPTHFNDIRELSEGFLDRVEHDTLILYGPVPYEDGSDIDFVVLLADGTSALEGKARVRAAVDGGAERVPETRYDIVLEALELDGRYEVVFERLVMARQAVSDRPGTNSDAPVTGEIDAATSDDENDPGDPEVAVAAEEVWSIQPDEVEDVAVAEEKSMELSMDGEAMLQKYADSFEEQGSNEPAEDTVVSDQAFEDAFRAEVDEDGEPLVAAEPNVGAPVPKPSMAAPPDAPPAPAGLNLVPPPEGLTRPSRAVADEDLLAHYEAVGEEETSGLFRYEDGLPIPSRPPLPDLDPARRVAAVEANDDDDVEDSEPPEANDDYEEIRISELAESAEEG